MITYRVHKFLSGRCKRQRVIKMSKNSFDTEFRRENVQIIENNANMTVRMLAKEFDISKDMIRKILHRKKSVLDLCRMY